MKKQLFAIMILIFMVSNKAFSESLLGLNFGTGYRNNNFEYNGLKHNINYVPLFIGGTYTFYPSYRSIFGFSTYINIGPDVSIGSNISGKSNVPYYHYTTQKEEKNSKLQSSGAHTRYTFNTGLALNLRLPVTTIYKSFTYMQVGGIFQHSIWDMNMVKNMDAPVHLYLSYQKKISCAQNSFSLFAEIGQNYGMGEVSVQFVYDLFSKSEMTDNRYIRPNSFSIIFSCRPLTWRIEGQNDKTSIQKILAKEDVYSEKYRLYDEQMAKVGDIPFFVETILNSENKFEDSILDIPIITEYYRRWWSYLIFENWYGASEPFIRTIRFTQHKLSNGILGTDEYLEYSEDEVSWPFYTEAEKQKAFEAIVAEYDCLQQHENRVRQNIFIAENQRKIEEEKYNTLYNDAITSKNIDTIAEYIKENRYSGYFFNDAYNEIAKILTKNDNIKLQELLSISNPYSLDKNCIYLDKYLSVHQWTGDGTFLAKTGTGELVYIRNVYDLSAVKSSGQNAYLKYIGTYEYSSVGAGLQVVAKFDLIYSF